MIGPKKKRKRVKDGKEEESENSKSKDNEPVVQEKGVFYGKTFLLMFKKYVCLGCCIENLKRRELFIF